jgi:hypothetical protein
MQSRYWVGKSSNSNSPHYNLHLTIDDLQQSHLEIRRKGIIFTNSSRYGISMRLFQAGVACMTKVILRQVQASILQL